MNRAIVAAVIALVLSAVVSAQAQNTVTFDNQSGEPALVKLIGPTSKEVEVPNATKQSVEASAGRYFIKVRYGSSGQYRYSKGEEFEVKETATTRSDMTITLHKVSAGNYSTKLISENEFATGSQSAEDKLQVTTPSAYPISISWSKPLTNPLAITMKNGYDVSTSEHLDVVYATKVKLEGSAQCVVKVDAVKEGKPVTLTVICANVALSGKSGTIGHREWELATLLLLAAEKPSDGRASLRLALFKSQTDKSADRLNPEHQLSNWVVAPIEVINTAGTPPASASVDGVEKGRSKIADFGMSVANLTPDVAERLGLLGEKGVVITSVKEGSVAIEKGIRRDDVIIEANNQPIANVDDLAKALGGVKSQSMLLMVKSREGSRFIVLK